MQLQGELHKISSTKMNCHAKQARLPEIKVIELQLLQELAKGKRQNLKYLSSWSDSLYGCRM